ncbi:MAG TPA: hypothetical protein VHW02_12010 [Rhizomicrobium sp.]|nr:hypothetical protein [Rhizomicrobium sp.]
MLGVLAFLRFTNPISPPSKLCEAGRLLAPVMALRALTDFTALRAAVRLTALFFVLLAALRAVTRDAFLAALRAGRLALLRFAAAARVGAVLRFFDFDFVLRALPAI